MLDVNRLICLHIEWSIKDRGGFEAGNQISAISARQPRRLGRSARTSSINFVNTAVTMLRT